MNRVCAVLALLLMGTQAWGMDIVWTRMTGQYPVEASPAVANVDGKDVLLAVNRGGQVMVWGLDGANVGGGEDGLVAELPKGTWTSTPVVVVWPEGQRLLFCSVEGLVVALDAAYHELWRYQLPGGTGFGHAAPVALPEGKAWCWGDDSGKVTCLDLDGKAVWQTDLAKGVCGAPLQTFVDPERGFMLLAASGSTLCCLNAEGGVVWSRDLGGAIGSRPEIFTRTDTDGHGQTRTEGVIFCGAGSGSMVALDLEGETLWSTPIGDEMDSTIVLLPRPGIDPLVVCRGLWGNLNAVDLRGNRVWTHLFRDKGRGRPLVFDANGDGRNEVLVTTYGQHAYLFDDEGNLLDDLKLSGCINGSPVIMPDGNDVIVMTAALLAQRLKPGAPRSPYGAPSGAMDQTATRAWDNAGVPMLVENPRGGLFRLNVSAQTQSHGLLRYGVVSARSSMEIPFADMLEPGAHAIECRVAYAADYPVELRDADAAVQQSMGPNSVAAFAVAPYSTFSDTAPACALEGGQTIVVDPIYQGEIDEGACVIASTLAAPCRLRVTVLGLATEDGRAFGGKLELFEAASTGTVNGERVADALIGLGDAGLLLVPAERTAKVWVRVDARGAEAGVYLGKLLAEPIMKEAAPVTLGLEVHVADLKMNRPFPLVLCTWDYVPNKWFPDRIPEVLDAMADHGIDVFPRTTTTPKAEADALGNLTFDWSGLDAELDRLKGRGQILFQIGIPPIHFAAEPSAEAKRAAEVAYLHQWRDHIAERGWTYDRYALYPVDEPGLGFGQSVDALIEAGKLFREADPQFRIYTDPVPTLSRRDFERIEPYVDVWAPNMRLVTGLAAGDPRIARIMASGKEVWSYDCVSQVRSLSPLRYNRANAWRAHYFGLTGIGVWTYSTTDVDPWLPGKGVNDEYTLVYPGALPVPSVRLEAERDGLEDVAAMALLEDAMREHGGDAAAVQEAADELRMAKIDILELSCDAFVESRDYLRAGQRRIWHAAADVEAYRTHRKRIEELTLKVAARKS